MPFDTQTVAKQMSKTLGVDLDDIEVEDSPLESFGAGEAMQVEADGEEYTVVPDEDTARDIAIAAVTQDLEDEPEIFNASFLEQHIDMEALEKWVFDAGMEDDYADDIATHDPDRFWEEMEQWGLNVPEPEEDEDGDEVMPEPEEEHIEALREAIAKDRSERPMEYFEDMYGRDEATKQAIEAVGIDTEAAAEDAVQTDGWAHFLSRYDGNYSETSSGFVYWREN